MRIISVLMCFILYEEVCKCRLRAGSVVALETGKREVVAVVSLKEVAAG